MKSYILGLFAGDGWFEKRGISIGAKDEKFALKIQKILEQEFQRNIAMKKRKFSDGHELYIISLHSKDICNEFKILLSADRNKSKTFDRRKPSIKTPTFMWGTDITERLPT